MQLSIAIVGVIALVAALVFGLVALFNALESGHLGIFFRPHTVMMLDKSVEILEKYEDKYGQYPDTIESTKAILGKGDIYPGLDFMGPIRIGERIRSLYYEPIENGKGYYLFGIGLDDKPFSEDDVYPTESATEKSDGFRKPEFSA